MNHLTALEKSHLLVSLNPCWSTVVSGATGEITVVRTSDGLPLCTMSGRKNFFTVDEVGHPYFMPLAWELLNALHCPEFSVELFKGFQGWWEDTGIGAPIWWYSPKEAQQIWLKNLLALAARDGMVYF